MLIMLHLFEGIYNILIENTILYHRNYYMHSKVNKIDSDK